MPRPPAPRPGSSRRRREADRRVHRVAASDPVPGPEHLLGLDVEPCNLVGARRDGDEVLRDRCPVAEPREHPSAGRLGVRHRLERRQRLRGDDEQRLLRVEVAGCLPEVGAVHVQDEAEREVATAVGAKRPVGDHRPEVRASNADVHYLADGLAGVTEPGAPRGGPPRRDLPSRRTRPSAHGDDARRRCQRAGFRRIARLTRPCASCYPRSYERKQNATGGGKWDGHS